MNNKLITRKKHIVIFFILLLVNILIRVYALYFQDNLSSDSLDYLEFNKDYSASKDLQTILLDNKIICHPPLIYMTMYALNYLGVKNVELGMRTIIFTMGILLPIVLFTLVYEYSKNVEIALYTLAIAAVHPFFVRMSCEVLRDPFFLFFSSLFLLEICLINNPFLINKIKHAILCGVCFSLSCLSRFESIDLFLLAPLALYLVSMKCDDNPLYLSKKYFRIRLYLSLFVIIVVSSIVFTILLNYCFGIGINFYRTIFDYRFNNLSS